MYIECLTTTQAKDGGEKVSVKLMLELSVEVLAIDGVGHTSRPLALPPPREAKFLTGSGRGGRLKAFTVSVGHCNRNCNWEQT